MNIIHYLLLSSIDKWVNLLALLLMFASKKAQTLKKSIW